MKFKRYLNEIGFKNYPTGWTKQSVIKFAGTLSSSIGKDPDEKGGFSACTLKMRKEMGEGAEGFCAAVLDTVKGTTMGRGKHK